MKSEILFEEGSHKWIVMGRDLEKKEEVIDTNEYIIINEDQAMLLDPGGIEIFPQVLTEITKYVSTDNIKVIFASHQDPDISSSLAMWLDLCPNVKVYCSWIWTGFIAHFGMGTKLELNPIPDEGMEMPIGTTSNQVYFVPAHYCHSSGNFSVFDPKSDILFSGDIGAALLPKDEQSLFVEDFTRHIQFMEAFHLRWMPSTNALQDWVKRARSLNPSMICPQHGSIFRGADVKKFLDWLESLNVGRVETKDADHHNTVWLRWRK